MKKKRRRRSALTPILVALMLFFICLGVIALIVIKYKENMQPIYKEISVSEEVSAKAYVWLNKIDGMSLSYDEVRNTIGDICITVELSRGKKRGVYQQKIVEDSIYKCTENAYNKMADVYWQVVAKRLMEDGYEGPCNRNTVEKLMQEAYGVSIVDYLKGCQDLMLLPEMEMMEARYNQEVTDEKN